MRNFVAALTFAPLAAGAGIVEVQYWGTVTESLQGSLAEGTRIQGSYLIDTLLAPPDRLPSRNEANYIWNDPTCELDCIRTPAPSGFVRDPTQPFVGDSDDHVWISDGNGLRRSEFGVENTEWSTTVGSDGSYEWVFKRLEVSSIADFLVGDRLDQSFDLHLSGTDDDNAWLSVWEFVDGVASLWNAAIDRVFVNAAPRVCRF
jgi:hypothetical protein